MIGRKIAIRVVSLMCKVGWLGAFLLRTTSVSAAELESAIAKSDGAVSVYSTIKDSSNPFEVLQYLIEARDAYAAGNYIESARAYQTVLLHDSSLSEAQVGYSEALYAIGDVELAGQVLPQNCKPIEVHGISQRCDRQKLLTQAARKPNDMTSNLLRQAIVHDPADFRLRTALAREYDRRHLWMDSQTAYGEALSINPDHAPTVNNLGMSLLRRGYVSLARAQFERAVRLKPKNRLFDNNWRLTLLVEGDVDAALKGVPKTRQVALLTDGALFLKGQGQTKRSQGLFERAKSLDVSYNPIAETHLAVTSP